MATTAMRFRAAEPAMVEQRRERRYRVDVTRATVRQHGEQPCDAELVDVSAYGCRLSASVAPDVGERLWLRFAGGAAIPATLIWRERDQLGCRFDTPLDPAFVRSLTLRLL